MKFLFSIVASLLVVCAQAQLQTTVAWTEQSSLPRSEVIYYTPNENLEWADFKGTPFESRAAAVTVSGFGYKADVKTVGNKGQLTIKVYCYFNKNKSWVKPGKTIPYILTHEQHHFDISYIAANIFVEKLKGTVFTLSNFNQLLPKIYNESCLIMNKMQDEYDGQTKNGQLRDVQFKWNEIVDKKISQITK